MAASGRVCTGFSYPFVGLYACSGENVTFSNGMELARGVDISFDITASEDNDFYANNVVAESDNGKFAGGKVNLTVDGLHPAAEKFIAGLPEPEQMTFGESKQVKVTRYGEGAKPPYVGIGVVVRYESDGVELFTPIVLLKAKFHPLSIQAKTQEKQNKDWQPQKLTADLARDDTSKHDWKWVLEDKTTESEAVEILKAVFGVVA